MWWLRVEKEWAVEGDFWGLRFFNRFPYNREHKGIVQLDENNDLCLGLSLAHQDIFSTSA